jgi:hypothetical protein
LDKWESIAERKIREAIEAGEFDNLPKKGQPIKFDIYPVPCFPLLAGIYFLPLPWSVAIGGCDAQTDRLSGSRHRLWDRRNDRAD